MNIFKTCKRGDFFWKEFQMKMKKYEGQKKFIIEETIKVYQY